MIFFEPNPSVPFGWPILLTRTNGLNEATKREIQRLNPERIVILGGKGAVNERVETELSNLELEVERIEGKNRYEPTTNIAKALAEVKGVDAFDSAILVYGKNFPDALAAASHAARLGYPILLTETDTLPASSEQAIKDFGIGKITAIGGTNAISESLVKDLQAERVAGDNRYLTALAVAKHFEEEGNSTYLATGRNFADAITGGVLAAKHSSSILLVNGSKMEAEVESYMEEKQMETIILGGTKAVAEEVWTPKEKPVEEEPIEEEEVEEDAAQEEETTEVPVTEEPTAEESNTAIIKLKPALDEQGTIVMKKGEMIDFTRELIYPETGLLGMSVEYEDTMIAYITGGSITNKMVWALYAQGVGTTSMKFTSYVEGYAPVTKVIRVQVVE